MIQLLKSFLSSANAFLWSFPLPFFIAVVGLFFTIKTKGFQFVKLKYSVKNAFKKNDDQNGISSFAAACTALSATVGTGNIVGVAGAIALGGAGTVFWMWITAFLGMIIKFAEIVLAMKFRVKLKDGFAGGPMYYIRDGLPRVFRPFGVAFALLGVFAAFGSGNAVQINTATQAIIGLVDGLGEGALTVVRFMVGITAAVIVGVVLIGGAARISQAAEALVPAMVVLYLLLAFGVIIARIKYIPAAVSSIFWGAFCPRAVTGGAIGSFFLTFQKGISRGIFTNEAGMGTSAIAHAAADVKKPLEQGLFGIFEVFVDTVVMCTVTAFAILCSKVNIPYGVDFGATIAINAFSVVYGDLASAFLAVPLCFFAFTSVIGWGFYGKRCMEFLVGEKSVPIFLIFFCASSVFGAVTSAEAVWLVSEFCNALMAAPNMLALVLLAPCVIKEVNKQA